MITDLLEAAKLACDAYFLGSDRSKLSVQETMRDLRACVNEEIKKRAQDETQRLTRPALGLGIAVLANPQQAPVVIAPPIARPPPFNPGNQPHA